jgi:hypothetical protein
MSKCGTLYHDSDQKYECRQALRYPSTQTPCQIRIFNPFKVYKCGVLCVCIKMDTLCCVCLCSMRERQGGTVGWLCKAARIFENTFRMYSNALNFQIGAILNLFSRYEDYVSLGVASCVSVLKWIPSVVCACVV